MAAGAYPPRTTGPGHPRFENVDHALTQSRVENGIVDAALTVCYPLFGTVVDKHQVQVRAIAQLDATELAVAKHGKPRAVPGGRARRIC